jgi:hypothetical protein
MRDIRLAFILFLLLSGYGAVVYLAVLRRSISMIGLSIVGFPFALVSLCLFIVMSVIPFQIAASLWRTRVLARH